MDWTSGYVTNINYTFGYYPELNPLRLEFALANYGVRAPQVKNACELGFGHGVNLCINSTNSGINWYGTDFNPSQALFAKSMAAKIHNSVEIYDEDFLQFCSREDLPQFEFVVLHGIWSWVSNENRLIILNFLKEKLAIGGVLYVSYNTQPGLSSMIPFRDLLTRHATYTSADGQNISKRIDAAIEFADKLLGAETSFIRAHPQVKERLEKIKVQDRRYLAHEYFNADWYPMGFAEINDLMDAAKMTYVGSANLLDAIPDINFSAKQKELISSLDDPIYQEVVKDLCINQGFRKDYWVKGVDKLSTLERKKTLLRTKVSLMTEVNSVPKVVTGHLGDATLSAKVYDPILSLLKDREFIPICEIIDYVQGSASEAAVLEAILVLVARENIAIAADEELIKKSKLSAKNLNSYLVNQAESRDEVNYLVSPVTLTAVPVNKIERLILLAMKQKCKTPHDIAKHVWDILSVQGHKLIKEGVTLQDPKENIAQLKDEAALFLENKFELFKNLKIAPL